MLLVYCKFQRSNFSFKNILLWCEHFWVFTFFFMLNEVKIIARVFKMTPILFVFILVDSTRLNFFWCFALAVWTCQAFVMKPHSKTDYNLIFNLTNFCNLSRKNDHNAGPLCSSSSSGLLPLLSEVCLLLRLKQENTRPLTANTNLKFAQKYSMVGPKTVLQCVSHI